MNNESNNNTYYPILNFDEVERRIESARQNGTLYKKDGSFNWAILEGWIPVCQAESTDRLIKSSRISQRPS